MSNLQGDLSKQECICSQDAAKQRHNSIYKELGNGEIAVGEEEFPIPERLGIL